MRIIPLLFALVLSAGLSNARETVSFAQLRDMADAAPSEVVDMHMNRTFAAPGTVRHSMKITEDLFIEGYVLTEPDNPNKDLHYSIHYTTANSASNIRCVYLLGMDGKLGLRVNFTVDKYVTPLKRYHRVCLNLKDALLCKEAESYIVHGLTDKSIIDIKYGDETTMPVPPVKKISELTDDDIFTYVTLTDCEFVFKDGSYINIYEEYGRSGGPTPKGVWPNNAMNDLVSCECIEEKEVIRYQIETACSYCEGDKEDGYEIYPNGEYMPDRLKEKGTNMCSRWKGGTLVTYAQSPSPYFTKIYCKVYCKRTYAYRSGREVTQYEYAPHKNGGYDPNNYVEWLKRICAISPISNYNMKEVDATQENAAVFVQLIKFICKANRLITELADSDKLLAYAGYLNDGPLQLEFFNDARSNEND